MEKPKSFREVIEDPSIKEIHYQPKRKFLPIIGEHGAYQADLMFLDEYARQNHGYNGILTLVNIPTRYGYAVPFKSKSDTLRAFKEFVVEARRDKQDIVRLETDNGSEFLNKAFQDYLKSEGITHTTAAPGDHRKQGIIERFNQTLRGWIERWLTEKKVNNWVDNMNEILEYYNTRKHKTTGVAPAEMTKTDEDDLRDAQYKATQQVRAQIDAIKPGDRVRVLLHKKAFGKGRLRWSDIVYTIQERVPNSYTFRLEETDTPQKYSDIQLVGKASRDIRPKAPETVDLAKKRSHALKLSREQLTPRPGVRAAEELIESQEPAQQQEYEFEAPTVRRSTRERKAPGEWWKV